jgi:uncharacterized protein YndB with AHSA1/START domain
MGFTFAVIKTITMANQDLTISFIVDKTPKEVFAAVSNPRGWWGAGIEGGTEMLNDEFTYRHKEFHYTRHKLIEVVPNRKMVWLTTESLLSFIEDKEEWTGSKLVFEITDNNGRTELRFTHEGLQPDNECYDACSKGWSYYIGSLKDLITKGEGKPDPAAFAQEVVAGKQ